MSRIDQKQINRLYGLLNRVEIDPDTIASLRWAIFTLENMDQQERAHGADLIAQFALKQEEEINEIMDTGVFNEIVKGYLVRAMTDIEAESADIRKAIVALEYAFDDMDAEMARKMYRKMLV